MGAGIMIYCENMCRVWAAWSRQDLMGCLVEAGLDGLLGRGRT